MVAELAPVEARGAPLPVLGTTTGPVRLITARSRCQQGTGVPEVVGGTDEADSSGVPLVPGAVGVGTGVDEAEGAGVGSVGVTTGVDGTREGTGVVGVALGVGAGVVADGDGEGVGVVEDGDGTGTGVAITVDAAGYTPVTVIVTDGGFS